MHPTRLAAAAALLWLTAAAPPSASPPAEASPSASPPSASPLPASSPPGSSRQAAPSRHRRSRAVHAAAAHAAPAGGVLVVLAHRPLTAEDAIARQLTAPDVRASAGQGDPPLVLVGTARLGPPGQRPALFVQLQSADLCGSAGCSTSVYLHDGGEWRKVLDSISGPIRVDAHRHGGMADLVVGDDDRWVWTGSAYADTVAAPPIIDLRQSVARHRAALARGHGS